MEDEPISVPCTVICHTEGCSMSGEVRVVNLFANAAPPVYRASCAKCDQPITDVTVGA